MMSTFTCLRKCLFLKLKFSVHDINYCLLSQQVYVFAYFITSSYFSRILLLVLCLDEKICSLSLYISDPRGKSFATNYHLFLFPFLLPYYIYSLHLSLWKDFLFLSIFESIWVHESWKSLMFAWGQHSIRDGWQLCFQDRVIRFYRIAEATQWLTSGWYSCVMTTRSCGFHSKPFRQSFNAEV